MECKYIIGVDGGGTKTDYLLFSTDGMYIDSMRVGSRSHEVLPGGFEEVEKTVLSDLEILLSRNSLEPSQIAAAAFGMAGIDTPSQLKIMEGILRKTNYNRIVLSNDSVLGIKAGCPSGIGICSINGTGTVVTGINEKGEILQVGGIGYASGDSAGGAFIAGMVLRAVYDYYYRCGAETILSEKIMNMYQITDPLELLNVINEKFYTDRSLDVNILTYLFEAANTGDVVAVGIVREVGEQLAKSVAGCIKALKFKDTPEVVLAGSVWLKSNCHLLPEHFKECIYRYSGKVIEPIRLQVIPATGAIIWALELAQNRPASQEQRLLIKKQVAELGR